jgi:hypothetical protein
LIEEPVESIATTVTRMFAKLLVLLAVLLMPLGMTTAASAAPSSHHDMAGMPMSHCPDGGSRSDSIPGIAACTMVCSAALPAADLSSNDTELASTAPLQPAIVHQLHGLHPETATPPPRRA